ncbi:hypothetical protein fugu_011084 [Takifugu bimaculatus]|uniref:Uncharacterized protein n=1 Tax=Takifugu bimaculatus TaxID=433685 RepID=A0A4Z2CBT4_9TELE|nr:hypothetical protein fugu_011084 [Takifugu bimaculatus]
MASGVSVMKSVAGEGYLPLKDREEQQQRVQQFNKDCRLTAKGGETRPHLSRCMLGKAAFLCIIKGRIALK